jgi:hypothetical protein
MPRGAAQRAPLPHRSVRIALRWARHRPSDRGLIVSTHVAFLRDAPLREIVAGRKKYEFRLSFGRLACEGVRVGDLLLLKRSGGEVEAACDVGEVRLHLGLRPEEVAELAGRYADMVSAPYFERYVPPANPDRPVNLAMIELLNVRRASLPAEATPRGVRSGWVANFGSGYATQKEP